MLEIGGHMEKANCIHCNRLKECIDCGRVEKTLEGTEFDEYGHATKQGYKPLKICINEIPKRQLKVTEITANKGGFEFANKLFGSSGIFQHNVIIGYKYFESVDISGKPLVGAKIEYIDKT